jgi:hypothetical protein
MYNAPFHAAATVARLLGITYTETDFADFPNQPPSIDGYVTFWDPGWSILRLRAAIARGGSKAFSHQTWYDIEAVFARLEEAPRYRQLRMEAVPESFGKTFPEQQALVPPGEEIPTARVVLMGMVIHFLASRKHLFPHSYVRCIDQTADSDRVGVGDFDSRGFLVGRYSDDSHYAYLGLASSRRS